MEAIKETAAKIAESAESGMAKTKATLQEKVEKGTTAEPEDKEMAEQKKEERVTDAEQRKREESEPNAATGEPKSYSTTGQQGRSTGMHQMSALPGHGTGEPAGRVVEGVVQSHPIGVATGTSRPSTAHNPHVGYGTNKGYGTGGAYT